MGLYEELLIWATVGACTNGLARGIRNKPLAFKPLGYLYGAIIGVGLGFVAESARAQQAEFNNRKVQALLTARESRQ
ncbi:uncharacterized protein SAPINGB_P002792 [Magnusiomyces paraingens]|uniref:Uncharacterized protein n=1 Tax=Magnusiomyces paraingens TaxID=2606893 RepID=A0A5E8BFV8_9ASCO|nr:uncharacterized protein SAPINGB_P002792 [Saprochaete ingens]VVT50524.1 unnamed protein product [Saprochaete ingens]